MLGKFFFLLSSDEKCLLLIHILVFYMLYRIKSLCKKGLSNLRHKTLFQAKMKTKILQALFSVTYKQGI
jgi:hypothetical protein